MRTKMRENILILGAKGITDTSWELSARWEGRDSISILDSTLRISLSVSQAIRSSDEGLYGTLISSP
jgi:hypothetical protein